MSDVTEEKLDAIMKQIADAPAVVLAGEDHAAPSEWPEDTPVRDLIQVLHDLVVYMRGDSEFVSFELDTAERVLSWSESYLERTK